MSKVKQKTKKWKEGMWNYRIVRHGDNYNFHEVYYDKKGKPHAWSAIADTPSAESPIELVEDVLRMVRAYLLPIMEIMSDNKGHEEIVEAKIKK